MRSNTLYTRELWERKEELEDLKKTLDDAQDGLDQHNANKPGEDDKLSELEAWEEELEALQDAVDAAEIDFGADELTELEELQELESEIGWKAMRDDACLMEDLEDYAREYAEDCNGIDCSEWPFNCIDWTQAADQISADFTVVTFQGTDYYWRE